MIATNWSEKRKLIPTDVDERPELSWGMDLSTNLELYGFTPIRLQFSRA